MKERGCKDDYKEAKARRRTAVSKRNELAISNKKSVHCRTHSFFFSVWLRHEKCNNN